MSERRYGKWSGNPGGTSEHHNHCIESISHGYCSYQCSRKRGHGPKGLYCKQHAKKHGEKT